tara:strand:- start:243 stop:422 length:180 start_codon:yes stop_codon:yes gene_type:complete
MKVGDLVEFEHKYYGYLRGIVKLVDVDEYGHILVIPFDHPHNINVLCGPKDVEVISASR